MFGSVRPGLREHLQGGAHSLNNFARLQWSRKDHSGQGVSEAPAAVMCCGTSLYEMLMPSSIWDSNTVTPSSGGGNCASTTPQIAPMAATSEKTLDETMIVGLTTTPGTTKTAQGHK